MQKGFLTVIPFKTEKVGESQAADRKNAWNWINNEVATADTNPGWVPLDAKQFATCQTENGQKDA